MSKMRGSEANMNIRTLQNSRGSIFEQLNNIKSPAGKSERQVGASRAAFSHNLAGNELEY